MSYLIAENIQLSRGEKMLLDGVDLTMSQGDKLAMVARNGSGKSTFLRILAGQEMSDGNHTLRFHPGVRIAFLDQEPEFDPEATIWQSALTPDYPPHEKLINEAVGSDQGSGDSEIWKTEAQVKELLFKLELRDLEKKTVMLSGGEKKRLGLVKLFATEPDFIILDEPTNHLDLDMIEWLEQKLKTPNTTLLIVTHDRYFLDSICNRIIELDRGKFVTYTGNYTDFLEKRTTRLDTEKSETDKIKKLLKKELEWIRRSPQARTTKSKARVDQFYKTKESVEGPKELGEMQIEIDMHRLGSKILECHNVSKAYGDKKLFEQFDYKFKKGEKVGVVGANGAGKTTLIKVMTGEIRPDSGKVILGDTLVFGHYAQVGIQLSQDKRVIDVIRDVAEYLPLKNGRKMSAEALLERFLFTRPQQEVYVSQLSGGERRRLYLLEVLMANPNFLILDEPTNDLDIITLNILEEYLESFQGCAIIISHDRYFMDKIVDHLFILEGNGRIKDYNGKYTDYRNEQKLLRVPKEKNPQENQKNDFQKEKEKKNKIRKIEREIEKCEDQKTKCQDKMLVAGLSTEEITALSIKFSEIGDKLSDLEDQWMELVE